MSYCFNAELVYYNAFNAIQDTTRVLSVRDISVFCNFLEKGVQLASKALDDDRCCRVIFRMNDSEFFDTHQDRFTKLKGWIFFSGKDFTESQMNLLNLSLGCGVAYVAMMAACGAFRTYIENRLNDGVNEQKEFFAAVL